MKASGPAFLFVRRTSSGAAPLPFAEALEQVRRDLARYAEKDTLFATHLEIADDPLLRETVEKYISDGLTEQKAIEAACAQICQTFTEIDDEYLRARRMTYGMFSTASAAPLPEKQQRMSMFRAGAYWSRKSCFRRTRSPWILIIWPESSAIGAAQPAMSASSRVQKGYRLL